MLDPLVTAVASVFETLVQRGIEVRPMGDGFFIRIAPEALVEKIDHPMQTHEGRSW